MTSMSDTCVQLISWSKNEMIFVISSDDNVCLAIKQQTLF